VATIEKQTIVSNIEKVPLRGI